MIRLLLFDVDGTLLRTRAGRAALDATLASVYGIRGALEGIEMQGCTDLGILRRALAPHGLPMPKDLSAFWAHNRDELRRVLAEGHPLLLLPGVGSLLEEARGLDDVHLALLTGNALPVARVKLEALRLWQHFPVGSFGSDHEDRWRLVEIAMNRAQAHWNRPFSLDETIIVGDTPRDVDAARRAGVKVVAVATGSHSRAELGQARPDLLLGSLNEARSLQRMLTL